MLDIRVELNTNRLFISIFNPDDISVPQGVEQMELNCIMLKRNFACITDLRDCTAFASRHTEFIDKIQKIKWDYGLGKTVRVIPNSTFGRIQREFLSNVPARYKLSFVYTLADAKAQIEAYEQKTKRDRRRLKKRQFLFKIVDTNGWEDTTRTTSYEEASKRLRQIRFAGRCAAIIVDADTEIRRRTKPK